MDGCEGQNKALVLDVGLKKRQPVERCEEWWSTTTAAREVNDCRSRILNRNERAASVKIT